MIGCLGRLVVLALMASPLVAEGAERLYITPAGCNLAVFSGGSGEYLFHAVTSHIDGQVALRADSAAMSVTLGIGNLSAEEAWYNPAQEGRYNLAWEILETDIYPKALLRLTRLEGWPGRGLAPGDSLTLTASGTFRFHGVSQPVRFPLTLVQRPDDPARDEAPATLISAKLSFRPTDFGVDLDGSAHVLGEIGLELHLVAYPVPYRISGATYTLLYSAGDVAKECGQAEVGEMHFLLAGLASGNAALVGPIGRAGVSADSLRAAIERHLREQGPDSTKREMSLSATARESYFRDAHWEAYRLGADELTPVHFLLAMLARPNLWVTEYLARKGLTYDRLRTSLEGEPKPAREIRFLGNPFYVTRRDSTALRYARNVWDMQSWDGKIYLGHGNSSNGGPAQNAGPIPVISYDPAADSFMTEFVVDEEQIHRYRVVNGHLTVPGHDPRESWELGNFYVLDKGGWRKLRAVPSGIHMYDLLTYRDTLFAAGGAREGGAVWRSTDGGRTWRSFFFPDIGRIYELFILRGELYAYAYKDIVYRYTGDGFRRVHVNLFPEARASRCPRVVRSIEFKGTVLYIGADCVNDHQWSPFAAYDVSRLEEAQRLGLPESDLPYDILVRDEAAHILTNRFRAQDSTVTVAIYRSSDLARWTEVVRFNAPTLARSFESFGGAFYVGLGTEVDPLSEHSGDIYRVVPASP